MKKTCREFTSEDISRFVDNELDPGINQLIAQHISHCPDCSGLAEQYKSMSALFSNHANAVVSKIDTAKVSQNLEQRLKNSEKKSLGNAFGFFGKNIYLKLASITAIFMISFFTLQGGMPGTPGPSAIVKSIDTDFASVMIIETQKEQHTIIWFSET